MQQDNQSAMEKLEAKLKELWRKSGQANMIAARHSEFVIEPKVFIGDQVHPEVLKVLVLSYLANASAQDSGVGNVDVTPDRLVIKGPNGKELVAVSDKRIINQFLAQQA